MIVFKVRFLLKKNRLNQYNHISYMGIFADSDTRQREESVDVIHQVLEGLRGENGILVLGVQKMTKVIKEILGPIERLQWLLI